MGVNMRGANGRVFLCPVLRMKEYGPGRPMIEIEATGRIFTVTATNEKYSLVTAFIARNTDFDLTNSFTHKLNCFLFQKDIFGREEKAG